MNRVQGKAATVKVHVIRGRNLAVRDLRGSDPYVVLSTKNSHVNTKVMKKNLNPEWNEDFMLHILDCTDPIRLEVFDKDRLTCDDSMGKVNVYVHNLFEAANSSFEGDGVIRTVHPGSSNSLVTNSVIQRRHGKVIQDMILRLEETECGEVELQLEWVCNGRPW